MSEMSNLAAVVYKRTYARKDGGILETWPQTVERVIQGNIRGFDVPQEEVDQLRYLLLNRKAGPAGRGWWFSGAPAHQDLGGTALNNCWFVTGDDWENFVLAQDLLMLGGGVGMSVEHRFSSKLPRIKKDVKIVHKPTKDAWFIVPDSREGWCELTRRVLKSFFVTGKSFTYSTVCVRGYGEPIKGFGGSASGPIPLIAFVEKLQKILESRQGRYLRPIDVADILCAIGEMVVAGNVRRSAIIVLGDAYDKEYLKAKRWDLGEIPTQRAMANFSVVCDDTEDLHPLFWKTYEHGEPFGIVNRTNIQKYGRMGELKKDTAIGVNPCAEATLEDGEPCNLQELALPNLKDEEEFILAARLMHRWGKRVTCEKYSHDKSESVVKRNRRIGTGITGCLESPLFSPDVLDRVYAALETENITYSKALSAELGYTVPPSIRMTLIKPSGTLSKMFDVRGEGIHGGWSKYQIQRVRISSGDDLIPLLREAGHYMEPVMRLDGSLDHQTMVVDFYLESPDSLPTADAGWDTWKQLEVLKMAQKHWADQAVSVTVYYKKDEIAKVKEWLADNLKELKTISFLCHNDHGFKQAPKEAITKEQYEKLSAKVRPLNIDSIGIGADLDSLECQSGVCPIK